MFANLDALRVVVDGQRRGGGNHRRRQVRIEITGVLDVDDIAAHPGGAVDGVQRRRQGGTPGTGGALPTQYAGPGGAGGHQGHGAVGATATDVVGIADIRDQHIQGDTAVFLQACQGGLHLGGILVGDKHVDHAHDQE